MFTVIVIAFSALVAIALFLELRGFRTTLQLRFRGDLARETAFLAQYGQAVCTFFAAWFVAAAHGDTPRSPGAWRAFVLVVAPVLVTSIVCMTLKRVLGRRRPNRENAGRFTGFDWRHDSDRESFPSSHAAGAMALTMALIHAWPHAAIIFWLLAVIVGLLRYLLDAHFPSDVLAGALIGLVVGRATLVWFDTLLPHV